MSYQNSNSPYLFTNINANINQQNSPPFPSTTCSTSQQPSYSPYLYSSRLEQRSFDPPPIDDRGYLSSWKPDSTGMYHQSDYPPPMGSPSVQQLISSSQPQPYLAHSNPPSFNSPTLSDTKSDMSYYQQNHHFHSPHLHQHSPQQPVREPISLSPRHNATYGRPNWNPQMQSSPIFPNVALESASMDPYAMNQVGPSLNQFVEEDVSQDNQIMNRSYDTLNATSSTLSTITPGESMNKKKPKSTSQSKKSEKKVKENASKAQVKKMVSDPPPQPEPEKGPRVKRPMNAFLIFSSERRPELQKLDPSMTTAMQSKILGDEWAKMDEKKKIEYTERAKLLKSEFQESHPDFVYTRRPNNSRKKRKKRKIDDENCPDSLDNHPHQPRLKRPMNAYLIFNKEMRPKYLQTNPNMNVAEISKAIGDKWKNLTEEERIKYVDLAESLKTKFHLEHPDYVYTRRTKADSHPDLSSDNESYKRKKKKHKKANAPKHPMSAFLFYLTAVRPDYSEKYPGNTVGTISRIIAERWRSLTPEERAPYEKQAAEDKARYAREMEAFNQIPS